MDWTQLLSPVSSAMEGHIALAVAGGIALISAPLLIKGAMSVAAFA